MATTKFNLIRTWHDKTSKAGKVDKLGLFDFESAMKYLKLEATPSLDEDRVKEWGEVEADGSWHCDARDCSYDLEPIEL